MDLSIREAATLLGISPRAVRARITRGDLPGVKRGGRWTLPRESLPLTEPQRRDLQARADEMHAIVEQVAPSRRARTRDRRAWSLLDLKAFRVGAGVLAALQASANPAHHRAAEMLEVGLLAMAEGCYRYQTARKVEAWGRARDAFSQTAARIALAADEPLDEPALGWLQAIEGELLSALVGLVRRVERRR